VLVLNLVSSPGTGKTAFLERTLRELKARGARVAALVGDLETDNDARRLAASGAPVRQINTHGICHLDAEMIGKHLDGWPEVALASWTISSSRMSATWSARRATTWARRFAWSC
jgi:Ni2+-binding GTPase involved in maturation of urease and hydrogenase